MTKSFKDYNTLHQFKDLPLAIKYRFHRGWADLVWTHGLWK